MVQTSVYKAQALGIPGEIADDSPRRVTPYIVNANSSALPTFGYAFTQSTAGDNVAVVGGTGAFLGVMISPKQHANYQNLTATLTLPNGKVAEICSFGHIFVKSATAVAPNYVAAYNNTTGEISGYAAAGSIPSGSTQIPNAKFVQVSAAVGEVAILELGN